MKSYKPSGYVILNLESHPLTLGESIVLSDKEIIDKCLCGKPVLCVFISDDVRCETWLTREETLLHGRTQTKYIQITIQDDEVEIFSDEL